MFGRGYPRPLDFCHAQKGMTVLAKAVVMVVEGLGNTIFMHNA